jgi:hypothetical protein
MVAPPLADTLSKAHEDTGSVRLEERERKRSESRVAHGLSPDGGDRGVRLAALLGLVALAAGLTGGVIAFMLWGPRVG